MFPFIGVLRPKTTMKHSAALKSLMYYPRLYNVTKSIGITLIRMLSTYKNGITTDATQPTDTDSALSAL